MTLFDTLGFVTLGRTTTPELGHGPTTESLFTGLTRNPWALDRMAGGSSGGAASAVAAGMVPIAHANDGAGSVRIPAACCGLVGLKVSRGRVSSGPGAAEGLFGMGVELAVTRSVRDTARVLEGVSRPMPGDPFIIRQPARRYTQALGDRPRRMRIGFTHTPWYDAPVDSEVKAEVERAARLLREMGHDVEEATPTFSYPAMRSACLVLWAAGMARWASMLSQATGRPLGADVLEAGTLAMVRFGSNLKSDDLLGALDLVNQVCRSVGEFFVQYDCLLTPTTAQVAQPLGTFNQNQPVTTHEDWFDRKGRFPPFLAVFNVTGQPAISLPFGESEHGLPIGVQVVGRFGHEEDLLALGVQLEQICNWEGRLHAHQLGFWKQHAYKKPG